MEKDLESEEIIEKKIPHLENCEEIASNCSAALQEIV